MPDREKIIKALEYCVLSDDCRPCEYFMEFDDTGCQIMKEALALLKEQEGTGCWEWITEDKYRCSECQNTTYVDECMEEPQYLFCPYCGHKMTFAGKN